MGDIHGASYYGMKHERLHSKIARKRTFEELLTITVQGEVDFHGGLRLIEGMHATGSEK